MTAPPNELGSDARHLEPISAGADRPRVDALAVLRFLGLPERPAVVPR